MTFIFWKFDYRYKGGKLWSDCDCIMGHVLDGLLLITSFLVIKEQLYVSRYKMWWNICHPPVQPLISGEDRHLEGENINPPPPACPCRQTPQHTVHCLSRLTQYLLTSLPHYWTTSVMFGIKQLQLWFIPFIAFLLSSEESIKKLIGF